MLALPLSIKELFYRTIAGEVSLPDFEQWLYTHEEVESLLPADDYLNLLTLNYHKSGAKYELSNLLSKLIDLCEYETYKLRGLLQEAQRKTTRLPFILMEFYDFYCRGYRFLQKLGLGYGLAVEVPYLENVPAETWDELAPDQQKELLAGFYPELDLELDRVLEWLATGKIVLTGKYDELGHHDYLDLRTNGERTQAFRR